VEYEDKVSPAIDVGFEVKDKSEIGKAFGVSLPAETTVFAVIWTTTPWTLPANQAVCVHPDLEYDLIKTPKGYLILAYDLATACLSRYQLAGSNDRGDGIAATCKGKALEGILLQHPFYERGVPIICGDHVTLEAGTGLVHTAPAHGQDDYAVGQKYNLPTDNPVGDDGKFVSSLPLVGGLFVLKANDVVIEAMKSSGHLLHMEKTQHSYPHCWRHKTPIIFRSTPQWFIGMDNVASGPSSEAEDLIEEKRSHTGSPEKLAGSTLRDLANMAVDQTEFFPGWGRARLEAMIRNRPDWCVSRQRNWGVPMPFFVNKETGQLHPRTLELLEQVAQRVEHDGIEAWFSLNSVDLLGNEADHYKKLTHTLDVWFDSGSTHYAVLRKRNELAYPADLYLEGSDQHRGWFQSSLLVGCAIDGRAPYRQLLTHGFTVDEKGYKMSKSRGNGIEPQDICNRLGADILRLWIASTDYSGEISLSEEILKRVTDSYRRIRNTLRFLLANTADYDHDNHTLQVEQWLEIDRYALAMTQKLQDEVVADYERYEFHLIAHKLQTFCSENLGGFYLDVLKDRLYTAGANSKARRSAQNALYHIAHSLVRLMAPILSFTSEEAWAVLCGKDDDSVYMGDWHTLPVDTKEKVNLETDWQVITAWRTKVNKQLEESRASGHIGSALAAEVDVHVSGEDFAVLNRLGDDLRLVFITSRANVHHVQSAAEERILVTPSVHTKCERCWHYRADVGSNIEHPTLCGRCISNLYGDGESRLYA